MNICYLSAEEPIVGRGGVDSVAVSLTEGFEARNHRVFHVAWQHNKHGGNASVAGTTFLPDEKHFDVPANAAFFEEFLRSRAIDAVIFAWGIGKKFPFSAATRNLGVPAAALFHNQPNYYKFRYGFFERIRRYFSQRAKYRWNADHCDALVVLATNLVDDLRRYLRRDQAGTRICAIGNPVRFKIWDDYSPAEKQREVLMVGLDLRQKRPEFLLKAWARVSRERPDWSLNLLGGTDKEIAKLREFAGTLGLERVHFRGFQNPAEFYKRASIFCMTSIYEGFGLVIVEAAAYGCARVVFDSVASAHDLIDNGKSGIIVPAGDVDSLAGTLIRLIDDADLRQKLGSAARAGVPAFYPAAVCAKWEKLFEELKGAKKS